MSLAYDTHSHKHSAQQFNLQIFYFLLLFGTLPNYLVEMLMLYSNCTNQISHTLQKKTSVKKIGRYRSSIHIIDKFKFSDAHTTGSFNFSTIEFCYCINYTRRKKNTRLDSETLAATLSTIAFIIQNHIASIVSNDTITW